MQAKSMMDRLRNIAKLMHAVLGLDQKTIAETTVFVMHAGSIHRYGTFFLGFPLVSSFVQVFEMLFILISLSKCFNSIYACPRVHKTHNGHTFMISMNERKIYKHVHVTMYSFALFW